MDTTGAGDAFIAATVYGLVHGFAPSEVLKFAGLVAACKCTEIGARAGQPDITNVKHFCSQKFVYNSDQIPRG